MQGGDLPASVQDNAFETSYLREVLGLEDGAKEEELEEMLIKEAKELGIDVDARIEAPGSKRPATMPMMSTDAGVRRSSVDSRMSQATSVVSTTSSVPQNGNGNDRTASRASLSLRDYDNFLSRGRPEGRTSMSFSPPKTPSASASVFSLPLSSPESSPKKHYRLMRGLSMLKLNRADSVSSMRGCPHCPRDTLSQRRAVHKLPCGHRLCTQALRDTIKAATAGGTGSIPSCCGIPIPGCLVEHVMTQQEQSLLLDRLDQWSQAGSSAPSIKSEARATGSAQRPAPLTAGSRTVSSESKVDSVAPQTRPKSQQEADASTTRPETKQLHAEQAQLEQRFLTWVESKRAQLASRHDLLRKEMRARHEATAESLEEHHATAISEAEDKQVTAEADMRALHEQVARDTATALKHMEAYCAGTYVSDGQPHGRQVTEQDLTELENARKIKDGLEGKHHSAINVLRGEQARRLKLRGQRQEKEMLESKRAQRKEELELERGWSEEMREFEEFVGERKGRMKRRWTLEEDVVRKKADGVTAEMKEDDAPHCWRDSDIVEGGHAVAGAGIRNN